MQIFLSHGSSQKPLIREIKKHLPQHLNPWLDEEKLLFGDNITASIESTIKSDTDYVLLFIDQHAAISDWVRKELAWTLQAEKRLSRIILLPIVIEDGALERLDSADVGKRKYLRLKDYMEASVRSLAESISSEIFALVCRDIDQIRQPSKTSVDRLADAEALLKAQAAIIRKAVFPHRKPNPISRDKLLEVVNSYSDELIVDDRFDAVLASILQRNLVPGLSYDGFEVFLVEEHASWKADVERKKKEVIGRKAVSLIRNGMSVLLDAGSTTEEVVRLLCKKIENRAITKITVATTSVNIADMISDCCVKMGFDDDFSAVRLFIPGGQVRPSTQAIVPAFNTIPRHVISLSDAVGGFDLGLVGVNGIEMDAGFTTHDNAEAMNKADILNVSRTRIIVGDTSKIGLALECKFAHFRDDIQFVVNNEPGNERLKELVAAYPSKILLA